jgi:hypothetical protein
MKPGGFFHSFTGADLTTSLSLSAPAYTFISLSLTLLVFFKALREMDWPLSFWISNTEHILIIQTPSLLSSWLVFPASTVHLHHCPSGTLNSTHWVTSLSRSLALPIFLVLWSFLYLKGLVCIWLPVSIYWKQNEERLEKRKNRKEIWEKIVK